MKRYCKSVNIYDIEFLEKCAKACLKKKWKRRDTVDFFVKLLHCNKRKVYYLIKCKKEFLIHETALHLQKQLKSHDLNFIPIWYKEKIDSSSQKVRRIGIQHISQQLFDYVAVYAMEDFLKRIGDFQCASIPNKGSEYGIRFVRKWLKEKDVRCVAQLDVKKCFPSIPKRKLITFINKYVANKDICWLVEKLISTFEEGLSIGSFLSQYLCNLYMSQLYHEISERMYFMRRGKRVNCVKHVLFYMDDIFLVGTNVKALHNAVKSTIEYADKGMGLTIKTTWSVKRLVDMSFVDIMGFRVYRDHITIRRRVFLRIRRAYKKAINKVTLTPKQAQKCISYFGYVKNTNSLKLAKKYKIYKSIKIAKGVISRESKIRCKTTEGKKHNTE